MIKIFDHLEVILGIFLLTVYFFELRCRVQPLWLETPSDQLVIFSGSGLCESGTRIQTQTDKDLLDLRGEKENGTLHECLKLTTLK